MIRNLLFEPRRYDLNKVGRHKINARLNLKKPLDQRVLDLDDLTSGYQKGDFPVTERLSGEILSLPNFNSLTSEQAIYVADNIIQFFEKN